MNDRIRATELRERHHLPLDEIAKRLNRSRSTVWYWIKDCEVPQNVLAALRRKGQLIGQERGRAVAVRNRLRERQAAYDGAKIGARKRLRDPDFRDFVVMYMAEGARKGRQIVDITNTDPEIIRLGYRWLEKLSKYPVKVYVFCRLCDDPPKLKRFWSREMGIPESALTIVLKPGPIGKRRAEYGVAKVRVSDVLARAAVEAYMDTVREDWRATSLNG